MSIQTPTIGSGQVTWDLVVVAFFIIWIVLGIGSSLFFWRIRNAALKRRVWPWYIWGTGGIFAAFTAYLMRTPWILAFVLPAVAVIAWLNVRATVFCDACGRTLWNQGFIARAKYCARCGAELYRAEGNNRET